MTVKVAFADDYEISRNVFSSLLGKIPGIQVTLVCSGGEELIRKLAETTIDVAVIDLIMPGMDGIETIRQCHELFPHIKCICISSYDNEKMWMQMVEAGAMAYLSKEARLPEFEKAIHTVLEGHTCYPPELQKLIQKNEEQD